MTDLDPGQVDGAHADQAPVRPDLPCLPLTVPARMVNEFVYCPRLFHLEWVQGQFASNDHVEEGNYVHRIVDEPSGALPAPDSEDAAEHLAGRTSRQFWVTSHELGLTAKIDLVEGEADGSVVPVDYKKGSPDRNGKAWPADEMQVVVQALLLADAGYTVHRAELWYAEVRRRVVVPIGPERLGQVQRLLRNLWQVAADPLPPPPLQDSPKCPGCSLVGICLPDEVNALATREREPVRPRRVMATDPESRPVYVTEQGALLGVRRGRLEIFKEQETLGSYRLIDVSQINLYGNVSISAQAMRELFDREIPVGWFSYGGWFTGFAEGLPGKNVDLRRAQHVSDPEVLLGVARSMVEGKIRNCRTLLRRNGKGDVAGVVDKLGQLASAASEVDSPQSLLGVEGVAARLYFSKYTTLLSAKDDLDVGAFDENGRGRRPPPDPVNAMISFVAALLVKDLTVAAAAVGFDPFVGVYHRPRYGRPALALDLAEEFRPLLVDSTVAQVVNNGEVRASQFTTRAGGCQLDRDGRRAVIAAYERRMAHEIKHPVFGYRVSYRRAMEVQARLLAAHLTGELDRYTPFTTR